MRLCLLVACSVPIALTMLKLSCSTLSSCNRYQKVITAVNIVHAAASAWDNAIRGDDSIITVILSTNIHAKTFLTAKVTEGVVEWIDITEMSPAYHAITYHPTKRRNHAQQSLAYTNYWVLTYTKPAHVAAIPQLSRLVGSVYGVE